MSPKTKNETLVVLKIICYFKFHFYAHETVRRTIDVFMFKWKVAKRMHGENCHEMQLKDNGPIFLNIDKGVPNIKINLKYLKLVYTRAS